LAGGFEVSGHVRNLPDGRVEVVAEGESQEIDDFLAAIRLEMNSYITTVTTQPEPAGFDPLTGFSIRH
jgi:acylphosphatase